MLCPLLSSEKRDQWVSDESRSRRVHTSHFRNRDKKWEGLDGERPRVALKQNATPSGMMVSKVQSYAGEPITEEEFTLFSPSHTLLRTSQPSSVGGSRERRCRRERRYPGFTRLGRRGRRYTNFRRNGRILGTAYRSDADEE